MVKAGDSVIAACLIRWREIVSPADDPEALERLQSECTLSIIHKRGREIDEVTERPVWVFILERRIVGAFYLHNVVIEIAKRSSLIRS